jgi:glycosyltransferase involved in cell wall biosynthesis
MDPKARYDAVFVWDNLGPIHIDRLNAVARHRPVMAIELYSSSHEYGWETRPDSLFARQAIKDKRDNKGLGWIGFTVSLIKTLSAINSRVFFLCNYERPYIFIAAIALRLLGRRVLVMQDSKFDDYDRFLHRELAKRLFYLPYEGAIVGSKRSRDYLLFLGQKRIVLGYNSSDVERIAAFRSPVQTPFADRPFVVLARMIPKKNLTLAIEAFQSYRRSTGDLMRRMLFIGDGPLRASLEAFATERGLFAHIDFVGWLQEPDALARLSNSVALLLTSTEEQFGNVVGEAASLGIPVIVSSNAGAADRLVRPFINGFILPPSDPEVWAGAMAYIVADQDRWRSMAHQSEQVAAETWDAHNFRDGVDELIAQLG